MSIQQTPEWFAERCGKLTASRLHEALAKDKSGKGPGITRENYLWDLYCERTTGVPCTDSYVSPAMQLGKDTEALARRAYSFHTDTDVVEVGFVQHPTIPMSGASPDGLVGTDGLIEIKCPNRATHGKMTDDGVIPGKYIMQMQWQIICADRLWCDFVSFNQSFSVEENYFQKRIERDDDMIAMLEKEARAFLAEVDALIERRSKKRTTA